MLAFCIKLAGMQANYGKIKVEEYKIAKNSARIGEVWVELLGQKPTKTPSVLYLDK